MKFERDRGTQADTLLATVMSELKKPGGKEAADSGVLSAMSGAMSSESPNLSSTSYSYSMAVSGKSADSPLGEFFIPTGC